MADSDKKDNLPSLGDSFRVMDLRSSTSAEGEHLSANLGGAETIVHGEVVEGNQTERHVGTDNEDEAPKVRISSVDRHSGLTILSNGLKCGSRGAADWNGARATAYVTGKGRFYYEVFIAEPGMCRVGWSTDQGNLILGSDKNSWGYGATGKKSYGNEFTAYGEPFKRGDTIGCLLDTVCQQITFSKNGRIFPTAFYLDMFRIAAPFFPAILIRNSSLTCNFGDSAFKYLPDGFIGFSSADCLAFRDEPHETDNCQQKEGNSRFYVHGSKAKNTKNINYKGPLSNAVLDVQGKKCDPSKGPKVGLSSEDKRASLRVHPNGLSCGSRSGKWDGGRANGCVSGGGKYYYEVKIEADGLCRVGWSTDKGNLYLGTDGDSWGFGGAGKKSNKNQFESYGEPFARGDTIGCLLNLDEATISWSKNGRLFPPAFSIPSSSPFFPAVLIKNSSLTCNFGDTPFKNLPEGYVGFSSSPSLSFTVRPLVGYRGVNYRHHYYQF